MISLTRRSILLALEQEKEFGKRQSLLKQLWHLERREERLKQAQEASDCAVASNLIDRP